MDIVLYIKTITDKAKQPGFRMNDSDCHTGMLWPISSGMGLDISGDCWPQEK